VTAGEGARYRLRIAERSLGVARRLAAATDWREAALLARSSIENAAKAIVACFTSVPKSHDADALLRLVVDDPRLPDGLRGRVQALIAEVEPYGMQAHVLYSYGDEENRIDPWEMVTEEAATDAVATATAALDVAQEVVETAVPKAEPEPASGEE